MCFEAEQRWSVFDLGRLFFLCLQLEPGKRCAHRQVENAEESSRCEVKLFHDLELWLHTDIVLSRFNVTGWVGFWWIGFALHGLFVAVQGHCGSWKERACPAMASFYKSALDVCQFRLRLRSAVSFLKSHAIAQQLEDMSAACYSTADPAGTLLSVICARVFQVGRVYPQAVYFPIRTLYLTLKIEQRERYKSGKLDFQQLLLVPTFLIAMQQNKRIRFVLLPQHYVSA